MNPDPMEEHEAKVRALQEALVAGEKSGLRSFSIMTLS